MPDDPAAVHAGLTGSVALVTGGGRGLGRAFAEGLAKAGAAVAVTARAADQLAETVGRITAAGGRAIAVPADVTDPHAVERMVATVGERLGPVDLLVNNAGMTTPLGAVWEVEPDAWWRCMESNLRGPFLCSRAVLHGMVARHRGRIINVASTAGLRAIPHYSAYSTSKAALIRFSETLAAETKPYGVRVFAINPGLVRTAMTEFLAESAEGQRWMPWVREVLATGRDAPPARAVNLVLLLACGRADSLTGRFLNITDDVARLLGRQAEIEQEDLYTMRLRVLPS